MLQCNLFCKNHHKIVQSHWFCEIYKEIVTICSTLLLSELQIFTLV